MSHILKLLLSIVTKRLEGRIDRYLCQTQFSFLPRKGTRDAIALFKIRMQRALEVNRKLLFALWTMKKPSTVCYTIRCWMLHNKMLEMLVQYNVDKEDVRLIKNLLATESKYSDQQSNNQKCMRYQKRSTPRMSTIATVV